MRYLPLQVTHSSLFTGALSLRTVEDPNVPADAMDLRRALATAGYKAGDLVVLVDIETPVLSQDEVEHLRRVLETQPFATAALPVGLQTKLGL